MYCKSTYWDISIVNPRERCELYSWIEFSNTVIEGISIDTLPEVVFSCLSRHINRSVLPYTAIVLMDSLVESVK